MDREDPSASRAPGSLLQGARGPKDAGGGWHVPNGAAAVLTMVPKSSVGGSAAAASPRTTASSLWLLSSIFSFTSLRTFSYFSFPEGRKHPQTEVWAQCHSHLSWEAPMPPVMPSPRNTLLQQCMGSGCCSSSLNPDVHSHPPSSTHRSISHPVQCDANPTLPKSLPACITAFPSISV